jgi:branched-subunit amino acid transport protein AzlD
MLKLVLTFGLIGAVAGLVIRFQQHPSIVGKALMRLIVGCVGLIVIYALSGVLHSLGSDHGLLEVALGLVVMLVALIACGFVGVSAAKQSTGE